jgi:hypothetical protein
LVLKTRRAKGENTMRKIIKATYKLPEINEIDGTESLRTHFVHILFEDATTGANELIDGYFTPLFNVVNYSMEVVYPYKDGYHFDVDLCDQALIQNARDRKILKSRKEAQS